MKKLYALVGILVLSLGLLAMNLFIPWGAAPGKALHSTGLHAPTSPTDPQAQDVPPQIRIRNSDPDLQRAWEQIGRKYTAQTGVEVVVFGETDTQQPTLFTVNGTADLSSEACVDLSATGAFGQLADMGLALKADGKYCGIAMEIDCFGLIFNENLLAEMVTQEEIRDISGFSALVQSIRAKGYVPFAGQDLTDPVAARLAALPGSFRTLARLWSENSQLLSEMTPLERFLSGQAVFYLGSTREYDTLVSGGIQAMGILPLYLDQGENAYLQQSLCITVQKYWCVSATASQQDIAATLDFLDWLVKPMEDGTVPVDMLELLAPYRQAKYYANPLENTLRMDISAGKTPVVCRNLTEPPAGFTQALTAFVREPTDENWQEVEGYLQ